MTMCLHAGLGHHLRLHFSIFVLDYASEENRWHLPLLCQLPCLE
jgi:hypothetical protein